MRQFPVKFKQYMLLISIAGLIVIGEAILKEFPRPLSMNDLLILAMFFVLIFLAEIWPIKSPGSVAEFTMTTPVVVSAFLSYGPSKTMIVTFASLYCAGIWAQYHLPYRVPIKQILAMTIYNTSIYIISVLAAALVFVACAGKTLEQTGGVTLNELALPLICWVATWTTVNMVLFTTGLSLYMREPWSVHARQSLLWYLPNYLIIGPSGILFAMLYQESGILGILLVVIPFLVGRQAMNQHAVQLSAYRETIATLGSYIQHYHPYTKGHLERVAELADKIAWELRLPPQSLMHIHNAGLLHDIGKVGVNEEVLNKVEKLTDEEWRIIKQHPMRGADILAGMKFLEPIVPWVRGHHERPDGRGYPDSLQGSEIPVEASVIAVADAFDAMIGGPDEKDKRSYRAPLTIDEAIDQVRYGTGTQFDSTVVKAFLRIMASKESAHDA